MRKFLIPNNLQIKQKLLTVGMDMYLLSGGKQLGIIKQKLLRIGKQFQLQDNEGHVQASAKQKIITLYKQFQVYDETDTKIGLIEHQRLSSMASFYDKYIIRNQKDQDIASTKELEIIRTSVDVYDNSGFKVADMTKGITLIKDQWSVNFYGNMDRRLLVFFPAIVSEKQEQAKKDK